MSDSILSMEEVAAIKAALAQLDIPGAKSQARATWEAMERLIATAEHWHREAQGKASVGAGIAALKAAFESTVPRDTHAAVAEERDRLRALVAGMREEIQGVRFLLDALRQDARGGPRFSHLMSRAGTMVDARPLADRLDTLLADPGGQRAYEHVAKDREDAQNWRALMSEAEAHLKEPEHAAFIEKATAAIAEGEEELRLLRAWESARASQIACEAKCRESEETDPVRVLLGMATADAAVRATWTALAAFRARQKGAPA